VEGHVLRHKSDPSLTVQITVSLMVTSFRRTDSHIQDIIGRVDQALYRAKNIGRNRVEAE